MIARAAAKPSRCFCYAFAWIAVGPIEVVAGVRACLASLDNKKGSVPVMLDLVLFRMSVAYRIQSTQISHSMYSAKAGVLLRSLLCPES